MSEARSQDQPTVEATPDVMSHSDAPTTSDQESGNDTPQKPAKKPPGPYTGDGPIPGFYDEPSTSESSSSAAGPSNVLTSPETAAEPLPAEVDAEEKWWDLKMSWSGKIYDIRIGSNDL